MTAVLLAAALVINVAPEGDDANDGTAASPLRTAVAARDALRKYRARHGGLPEGGATVRFADGEYFFGRPLELSAEDSGTAASPVVWKALNRLGAVITGDPGWKGWRRCADREVLSRLPEPARGKVVELDLAGGDRSFDGGRFTHLPFALFQEGERLVNARWPDDRFTFTEEALGERHGNHDSSFTKTGEFICAEKERLAAWAKEPELWAYGLWVYEWREAYTRVLRVDPGRGFLAVDPGPLACGIADGRKFYVFNAFSELDRPGEWVYDSSRRRVYLWPKSKTLPRFTAARGFIAAKGLRNVVFDGFVFEYAADVAVRLVRSEGCAVKACVIRNTLDDAVQIEGRGNLVTGCDMYELGAGGVRLTGGDYRTLTPGNNAADNNHIHHYGRVWPNYRAGVSLQGVGNRATHNLIHHTLHNAINFRGNDHYIGWNICHDTCMADDAGTIYCCQRDWTRRGTVIEHNLLHMTGMQPLSEHTKGIYLDDYSSGNTVRYNIVNRADPAVYIGGGDWNEVYGNVAINCQVGISLGSRGVETFSKKVAELGRRSPQFKPLERDRALYESEPWKSRYPDLLRVYDFDDAVFAHNALWNVVSNNVQVACGKYLYSNRGKIEPYTVWARNLEFGSDPGFEDYFNFGWEFEDGEARAAVGELGIAKMGLYASPDRASKPVRFGDGITPPRKLGCEKYPSVGRFSATFRGEIPAGVKEIATELRGCSLPGWGKGRRIFRSCGKVPYEWCPYRLSFLPACDAEYDCGFGGVGAGTLEADYDSIEITGAETGLGRNGRPCRLKVRKGVPVTIRFRAKAKLP